MTIANKIVNRIGKICDSLGANPKATYPVMLIALVKGICRPAFTMMDKTEKPETKKYTAIREGLTELIAIPTYFVCGELAAHIAGKLRFENVPKDVKESLTKCAAKNFMFLGVCTAALFVIPALCSAAIKPVMDRVMPKPKSEHNNMPHPKIYPLLKKPDISSFTGNSYYKSEYSTRIHSGVRVGSI